MQSPTSELSSLMKSDVTSNQCVGWGDNVHYLLWLVGKVFPFSLQLFNIREINLVMLETSPLHLDPRASSTSAVAQNIFPTCHNLPSCFIDNLCAHTHCIHGRQQEKKESPFPPYTISAQILLFILTRMTHFSPKKVTIYFSFFR